MNSHSPSSGGDDAVHSNPFHDGPRAGRTPSIRTNHIGRAHQRLPRPSRRARPATLLAPKRTRPDHDGMLATMVTIARDHALEAAQRADEEMRACVAGAASFMESYGVKDLLDTDGIRTTWGSGIFADRP